MDSLTLFALIGFGALGAIIGSFIVATVWRLRASDLASRDKLDKQEKKEYEQLITKSKLAVGKIKDDRSKCLSCQHRLEWYDLIPIASWLILRGKCRYCGKKIGLTEFMTEVAMAGLFSFAFYVLRFESWYILALWLMLLVVLAILFIYDLKWKLLPTKVLYAGLVIGIVFSAINIFASLDNLSWQTIVFNYTITWLCLGGIYLLLTIISKGAWVGDGDWLIGTIIALILGHPWLGMAALFLANVIGCLIVLIMVFRYGKLDGNKKTIPLGPLLIIALLLVYQFKDEIMSFLIVM
ncbi:MAG: prepilin peptidase [Candidatus Saccharibacteria bacterium]|nr:prepilin peptidase [Candidatus Saccharibacteria bacterium]